MEKRVFHNVIWDFLDDMPIERDDFNNAVIAKQFFNFNNSDNWDPNEIIIHKPKVIISYRTMMCSQEGIYDNEKVIKLEQFTLPEELGEGDDLLFGTIYTTLETDNKENFAALELLYKLHKQLLNKDSMMHLYFDGLEINKQPKNKYDYLMHFDFG